MWGIISKLLGLGETVIDRVIPDRNKARDQAQERALKQIDATSEGERAGNKLTPRAVILYAMAFSVVYGVVIQPFAKAFGLDLPIVDYAAPLRILLGLLGLDFAA
ncbi:MAG TPA: hypothetical protein VF194_19685 [Ferrovibrio sp.]|uniref:hypothetical protein n=1 Tax=Ferrovibrio sp. TaxID=1917215 RepID=UPI002ED32911